MTDPSQFEYRFDRYVNQGRRLIRPLDPFYLRQCDTFDLMVSIFLKWYYIFKGYLTHFMEFDLNRHRLIEMMLSLFVVNPIEFMVFVSFRMLKPDYYFLAFTEDDNTKYISLKHVLYKWAFTLLFTIVSPLIVVYAYIVEQINNSSVYRFATDRTNTLAHDQPVKMYDTFARDTHSIYLFDGIGTSLIDRVFNFTFSLILDYVHIQYYGPFGFPTIKYFRSKTVINELQKYIRGSTPFNSIPSFVEDTIIRILEGIYIDAGSSQNTLYVDRMTQLLVERITLEQPKSVTLLGFSQGSINASLIIDNMLKDPVKYADVLSKITCVIFLNGPLVLYNQYNLNQNYFKIYQLFATTDKLSNYPVDKSSFGMMINGIEIIPIPILNTVFFPHVSTLFNADVYEYIANIIVRNTPYLKDKLKMKPATSLDVFLKSWSFWPSWLISEKEVRKISKDVNRMADRACDTDDNLIDDN